MMELLTRTIRRYLTGSNSSYIFKPARVPCLGNLQSSSLYIHIPFCRNCCPYCPYNKVTYDEKLVEPYIWALLSEIKLYRDILGRLRIPSVYIGGGTPTLLIDQLAQVVNHIRTNFELTGDICVETSPADIDSHLVEGLKRCGINLVSIGVQSFNDKFLQLLGRKYSSDKLIPAVEKIADAGFSSVNVDMMFSLPFQTDEDLLDDLRKAIALNVNQITTYPLFTFPYSSVGRYRKLRKIKMPRLSQRRRQYYLINELLRSEGYSRVSVWGFKKGNAPRYSSVTRDGYIGLGAGAGSDTPNGFYLNTFSVSEYISNCISGNFPTAMHMPFTKNMRNYFWLYWRLYDTSIPKKDLYNRFGNSDRRLKYFIKTLKFLRLAEEDNDGFVLNNAGTFWVHLLQNYFALNYINKVWTIAMQQPWPEAIPL
jgi:putative oxygen-independent coproporphyrinogen III oxidase